MARFMTRVELYKSEDADYDEVEAHAVAKMNRAPRSLKAPC